MSRAPKTADRFHLLQKSPAAQQIAGRRPEIEMELRARPRKIWSVAKVARMFKISPRLLWQWIEAGYLNKHQPAPKRRKDVRCERLNAHRKGLSQHSLVKFLKELEHTARTMVPHPRPRLSPATHRCRELFRGLDHKDRPTPLEFAARANP